MQNKDVTTRKKNTKELVNAAFLSFHFEAAAQPNERSRRPTTFSHSKRFSHEQRSMNSAAYCLANYKFLMNPSNISIASFESPDKLVNWEVVETVIVSCDLDNEFPHCPICLDIADPFLSKITRCGHIYCHLCLLRHLSYEGSATCPICLEILLESDLKSVVYHQNEPAPTVGEEYLFELCGVSKTNPMFPIPQSAGDVLSASHLPLMTSTTSKFSRYIIDSLENIEFRLNAERDYLLSIQKLCELNPSSQCLNQRYDAEYLPYLASALVRLNERLEVELPSAVTAAIRQGVGNGSLEDKKDVSHVNDCCFFYQATSGDLVFCHPLVRKCLLSLIPVPTFFSSRVLEVEKVIVCLESRKRCAFLRHIPLHAEILLVEIDLSHLDKIHTFSFMTEIQKREKNRIAMAKKKQREVKADDAKCSSKAKLEQKKWTEREAHLREFLSGPVVGSEAETLDFATKSEIPNESHCSDSQVSSIHSFSSITRMGGNFPDLVEHPILSASSKPQSINVWGRSIAEASATVSVPGPIKKTKFKKGSNLFSNSSARSYK